MRRPARCFGSSIGSDGVIARKGVLADGRRSIAHSLMRAEGAAADTPEFDTTRTGRQPVAWVALVLGIAVVSVGFAYLPGRTLIPPLIESDYCYLLIAAERLYDGLGPTAPLPVAPFQPWTWRADWGVLTNWPVGYPLLICFVRVLLGVSAIEACRWISVVACATALAGWFVWLKRCVPAGVTGVLVAAVAAGCSVSTAWLVNPSTDLLLAAALPFVLLFTAEAIRNLTSEEPRRSRARSTAWLVAAGLTAGGLFWVRYASVFVPLAVALYLLLEWRHRRIRLRQISVFGVCAAIPIVALLLINHSFDTGGTLRTQLNLGHTVRLDLSPQLLGRAWWNFTDLGFYDYHPLSHWIYALWPATIVVVALLMRPSRQALRAFVSAPPIVLSTIVVVTLLAMLVGTTALFGDKYDYVRLARYYAPIKPLYFLLFVAPLMLIPRRLVRALTVVALLAACSWLVQQSWSRPYKTWLHADREATPYGQWSRCFEPGAANLYGWLTEQDASELIVVSNFHEYIALETGIPALPIPEDPATLDAWVKRIQCAREIREARVLFVLDLDNRWRDYWVKPPDEIIRTFHLDHRVQTAATVSAVVLEYRSSP